MPKPSIAELLKASGFASFTPELVTRAINALHGNVGANADERDWSAIMVAGNPLAAAETALTTMYQDRSYLLRNADQLVQNGYAYSQAEFTYRTLYARLGQSYSPAWSVGTVMEEYGKMSDRSVESRAQSDAFDLAPTPALAITSGADGFSLSLSIASTVKASDGKSLGRFNAGTNALGEQSSVVSGTLTPTSDAGKAGARSSQYFTIGTANADTIDTSGAGSQIDYIQTGGGADNVTAGAGDDVIYLGGGADTVTGGAGADVIYLGANDAANDTIIYTASGETGAGVFVSGGSTVGMDVLNDVALGDALGLWDVFSSGPTVSTSLLMSATANNASLVRGAYNADAATFTTGTGVTDDDYILQWADGTSVNNVIIRNYGTNAPDVAGDATADTLTFADTTPPRMTSATYEGTRVTITYTESLGGTALASDFSIYAPNYRTILNAVIGQGVNSNKVTLTLNSAIPEYGYVNYIFYRGGGLGIKDQAGNASSFDRLSSSDITKSDTAPPTISSAEYEGSSLKLLHSEVLTGTPEAGDYTVTLADASQVAVTSASLNGKVVTLTLASSVLPGALASVAYSAGAGTANSVKDAASPANAEASQTLTSNLIALFTNLNGQTVSGSSGIDKLVFAAGYSGVAVTDFTSGTDKVNIDALETYGATGFNWTVTSPYNYATSLPGNGTVVWVETGGVNVADSVANAAPYLSDVFIWTTGPGIKGTFVIVDDNSTGIFSYVSDGLREIEAAELTLMATIATVTATSDYLFA